MNVERRRALFASHHDDLRRFARTLASTDQDADDLLQDLAVAVLMHERGPADADRFAAWCRGVARNVAAHRYRSQARQRTQQEDRELRATYELGAGGSEDMERTVIAKEWLAARLDGLSARAQSLLRDRFVFEETPSEMAARLNVSAASVRMRLARLVAALRAQESNDESQIDRCAGRSGGN